MDLCHIMDKAVFDVSFLFVLNDSLLKRHFNGHRMSIAKKMSPNWLLQILNFGYRISDIEFQTLKLAFQNLEYR